MKAVKVSKIAAKEKEEDETQADSKSETSEHATLHYSQEEEISAKESSAEAPSTQQDVSDEEDEGQSETAAKLEEAELTALALVKQNQASKAKQAAASKALVDPSTFDTQIQEPSIHDDDDCQAAPSDEETKDKQGRKFFKGTYQDRTILLFERSTSQFFCKSRSAGPEATSSTSYPSSCQSSRKYRQGHPKDDIRTRRHG